MAHLSDYRSRPERDANYTKDEEESISLKGILKTLILTIVIGLIVSLFLLHILDPDRYVRYSIEYTPYLVERGDTLVNIINSVNDDYDGYYDYRELVQETIDENELDSPKILAGEVYMIPKLIPLDD